MLPVAIVLNENEVAILGGYDAKGASATDVWLFDSRTDTAQTQVGSPVEAGALKCRQTLRFQSATVRKNTAIALVSDNTDDGDCLIEVSKDNKEGHIKLIHK